MDAPQHEVVQVREASAADVQVVTDFATRFYTEEGFPTGRTALRGLARAWI
jgi:hypothetical protein